MMTSIMTKYAYYNEFDSYAAEWLRNLIKAGHIAPGEVDSRSIEDVRPDDLRGFTQCHFFAGIGGWSAALRLVGWPDDKPVWTGSCPCQPFSAAGKGAGFDDERHLWPAWFHLLTQCRPDIIFGEQVASKDALAWLDLVQADMEAAGYAFGPVDLCAAGIGAPHIRQRTWFVADAYGGNAGAKRQQSGGQYGQFAQDGSVSELADADGCKSRTQRGDVSEMRGTSENDRESQHGTVIPRRHSAASELADAKRERPGRRGDGDSTGNGGEIQVAGRGSSGELGDAIGSRLEGHGGHGDHGGRPGRNGTDEAGSAAETGGADVLADAKCNRYHRTSSDAPQPGSDRADGRIFVGSGSELCNAEAGPTNGMWRDADWLLCRDGKWRPVEPGTFPLATGVQNRVGRLRAYGNAINPYVAAEVIAAYMETRKC